MSRTIVSVALAEAINTNKIKIDKKIEKNLFDFIDYHTLSFFLLIGARQKYNFFQFYFFFIYQMNDFYSFIFNLIFF